MRLKEDIDELYGTDLLVRVADYNRDGTPDPEVIAKGLKAADEICDAYLSAQYTIPVTPTPGVVNAARSTSPSTRWRSAAAPAPTKCASGTKTLCALLEKISTGKVGLGLPPETGTDEDGNPTTENPNARRSGRSFDCGRA